MNVERALAEKHYADLSSKPFFGGLVDYICSGPVVAMVSRPAVAECSATWGYSSSCSCMAGWARTPTTETALTMLPWICSRYLCMPCAQQEVLGCCCPTLSARLAGCGLLWPC
jgi:hypothetical protein